MDSVTITATTDQLALNRLAKAIADIEKQTGRSTYQSVMYATVKICDSGRRDSKPGKKNRKLIPDPMIKGGWMVQKLTQRNPPKMIRVSGKNDKMIKIPRHGLAKSIWNIMAARAAATKSGTIVDFSRWHSLTVRTKPEVVTSTIRNKLTYLEAAYKGQEGRIIAKGTSALEGILERKIGEAIKRAG
jgi:hypothetical protein